MGLPWLKLFVETPDHTKVARLALELGRDADSALGIVVRLWAWVARVAPSGVILSDGRPLDIRRTSADASADTSAPSAAAALIEYGCRWSGAPGKLVSALEAAGLIDRIEGGFEVHDWEEYAGAQVAKAEKDRDHKRKDKERKAAARAAEKAARAAAESASCPRSVRDLSAGRPLEIRALDRDGDGDGEGEEKQQPLSAAADRAPVEAQASLPLLPSKPADVEPTAEPVGALAEQVRTVFEHWRVTMHKRPGELPTKLDRTRRAKVEARLREGYTVEQLCQAVTGCSLTPHNMGHNDRGTPYNDLELICRDAPHVDRFMATAAKAAPPEPVEEKTDPCAICGDPVGAVGRTRVGDAVLCVVCAQRLEHERDRPPDHERRAQQTFDAAWVASHRRSAA